MKQFYRYVYDFRSKNADGNDGREGSRETD